MIEWILINQKSVARENEVVNILPNPTNSAEVVQPQQPNIDHNIVKTIKINK